MDTEKHYGEVCCKYDFYYHSFYKFYVDTIFDLVSIGIDDHVVDIGGGTGEVAHMIWKQAKLNHPVICVDPSGPMLNVAGQKEGVIPLKATAEEFFNLPQKQKINLVLMIGCSHHFKDTALIVSKLEDVLAEHGVVFMLDASSFSPNLNVSSVAVLEKNIEYVDNVLQLIQVSALEAEVKITLKRFPVTKNMWYNFMRERMFSHLRQLSDEEIETGIKEMEKQYAEDSELQVECKLHVTVIRRAACTHGHV